MFSLATLFEDSALTPHGFCLAWDPLMIALHVVSDGVIALSYYSIPATIGVLLLRRRDVAFGWMGWL
ncbi:MAG: PAS domain-containing sensor histidine kinase, partial [Rhodospirillales bacterium]|nr:PAS domain-containing sensor histidine kinase [Rhodospirillales bacterium]